MFTTTPTDKEILAHIKLKEENAQKRKQRIDDLDSAFASYESVMESHNNGIKYMEEQIAKAAIAYEEAVKRNQAKISAKERKSNTQIEPSSATVNTARESKKPKSTAAKTPKKEEKPTPRKEKPTTTPNKLVNQKPPKEKPTTKASQQQTPKTSKKKENVAALIRRKLSTITRKSRSKQQSKQPSKKKKQSKGKKESNAKKPKKVSKQILTGNVINNNGNR